MNSFDSKSTLKSVHELVEATRESEYLLKLVNHGLTNGSISLHEMVESLGSSLTSQNPADRCLGVKFLADTLHLLPRNALNEEELSFLSAFFSDRLHDHHSTMPGTLHGMLALVNQENMTKVDIQKILQSLFRDVRCQSFPMSERRIIYNIFHSCLTHNLKVLKEMESEFVVGFVSAMDGEKDPRNLLLLFSIFPFVAMSLPLGAFTEDMFEVIAAYFPIDFVPPVHDPYGVSSEDLVLGLRRCLSSTDEFAQYCLPLLQEKLESDLLSAKVDALRTLISCCESYSASSVQTFLLPLWDCIRKEIVETTHLQVEAESLAALTALISCLERGPSNQTLSDSLSHLASCALMECLGHLSVPEHRLMFTSSNLLLAMASPSELLTKLICNKVLPLLVGLFPTREDKIARKNILEILAKFMNQMMKFHLFDGSNIQLQEDCWNVIQDGLLSSDHTVMIAASMSLRLVKDSLSADQATKSAEHITLLLLKCPKDVNLKKSLTAGLVACGDSNPAVLSDRIIPDLLNESNLDKDNLTVRCASLEALAATVHTPELAKKVVPQLWCSTEALLEKSPRDCIPYLQTIKKIVLRLGEEHLSPEYLSQDWRGVINCVLLSVKCILTSSVPDPTDILEELSLICQDLVEGEVPLCVESLVYLISGVSRSIPPQMSPIPEMCEVQDLLNSRCSTEDAKTFLLVYPLSGLLLRQVSVFEYKQLREVMEVIRHWGLHCPHPRIRDQANVLFSSLLNRAQPESTLRQCLDDLFPLLDPGSPDGATDENIRDTGHDPASVIFLLGWVVKALIMRASPHVQTFNSKLEEFLLSPHGHVAASCYIFLLEDHKSVFRENHGANVRLFYKQRFFQSRIDALVDQFNLSEGEGKFNTLLAISHLLPFLPQPVIREHLQTLLPVLVQGLSCNETAVVEGSVSTLSSLLSHSVDKVSTHVGSLIPRLFDIYSSASIVTRHKCLGCLGFLARLPSIAVLPYRTEVLIKLKGPLDDRKRLVRQQAAATKCCWVLVGSDAGT